MRWLSPLLNLVLQATCPLCDRPAEGTFCPACARQLQRCQLPAILTAEPAALQVFAWGQYEGVLKRAIAALKYEKNPQMAAQLGHWMGQQWQATAKRSAPWIVVPIPLHADKLKQRGFNQAELLAEGFCAATDLPLARRGLARQRATVPQFGLGVAERTQNLAGAFAVGQELQSRSPQVAVLLLDDIYTTGATVRSAAQTLRQSGIRVYGMVALARPQSAIDRTAQQAAIRP